LTIENLEIVFMQQTGNHTRGEPGTRPWAAEQFDEDDD
jgi:hypothetical protein